MRIWLPLSVFAVLLAGCSSVAERPGPSELYYKAYEATAYPKAGGMKPGSPEEKAAIQRFKSFFGDLSLENVQKNVRKTYAHDAYFNDTLKEITGIDTLEKYMVETAHNVESCTTEFQDVIAKDGDYYFRWVMTIKFKKFKKGEPQPSIGMTHIRFNKDGLISFHQDYWDAAANLFEKVPVVGWMIRRIKKRL